MYAIVEVKKSKKAPYRPNQEYYLEVFSRHVKALTLYPENEKEVLGTLLQYFKGGENLVQHP